MILFIGLSCKTQEIYLLVFCMRYIDLFMYFISLYNTLMKVFFISSTAFIVYMMRYKKPYCTVCHFSCCTFSYFSNFDLFYFNHFIDLWFHGWWFPTSESTFTCSTCADVLDAIRLDSLGAGMELQPLAWEPGLLTLNRYA